MTLLLTLVLAAAGIFIAIKVVKVALKLAILGGVAALLYFVLAPYIEQLL